MHEIQFLSEDTKLLKYLSSFCTFISKSDWAPHADQLVDMCDRQIIGLDLFKLARTLAACQHREGNLLREGETTIVFRLPRMWCQPVGPLPLAPPPLPARTRRQGTRAHRPAAGALHRRRLNAPTAKALERTGLPSARSTAAACRGAFTATCRG